jgi:MFS family permease
MALGRSPAAGSGTAAGRRLGGSTSFWLLGVLLGFVLFAASAPSPLYPVYQARWHFSAVTLTWVFAVYAFALLATLLTAGSISDHIGRRPALLASLLLDAVAMLVFVGAHGVGWLIAARIVQGVATGVATGTLSAALIDTQPPDRPGLGPLMSSAAPSIGLAAGALGAGAAVQYGPAPRQLIFWLLAAVFLIGALAVLAVPETVPYRPDWATLLRPRIGVPAAARGRFLTITPNIVATWALSGLYLSLGPSTWILLRHNPNRLLSGLPIVALTAAGAVFAVLLRHWSAAALLLAGSGALIMGVAVTLAGLVATSPALFLLGSALAGAGFGPAFTGAFRTLTPLAPPSERAALLTALYVVCYLAFSVPAVGAGFAVTHFGLRHTADWYAAGVIVLAATATAAFAAQQRRLTRPAAGAPSGWPTPTPADANCLPCPGAAATQRAGHAAG